MAEAHRSRSGIGAAMTYRLNDYPDGRWVLQDGRCVALRTTDEKLATYFLRFLNEREILDWDELVECFQKVARITNTQIDSFQVNIRFGLNGVEVMLGSDVIGFTKLGPFGNTEDARRAFAHKIEEALISIHL